MIIITFWTKFKLLVNFVYPRRWTRRLPIKVLAGIGFCLFLFISVLEIAQEDGYIFKRNRGLQCALNGASEIPPLSVGRARYSEGRMVKTNHMITFYC